MGFNWQDLLQWCWVCRFR